jgi:hypothetical protein
MVDNINKSPGFTDWMKKVFFEGTALATNDRYLIKIDEKDGDEIREATDADYKPYLTFVPKIMQDYEINDKGKERSNLAKFGRDFITPISNGASTISKIWGKSKAIGALTAIPIFVGSLALAPINSINNNLVTPAINLVAYGVGMGGNALFKTAAYGFDKFADLTTKALDKALDTHNKAKGPMKILTGLGVFGASLFHVVGTASKILSSTFDVLGRIFQNACQAAASVGTFALSLTSFDKTQIHNAFKKMTTDIANLATQPFKVVTEAFSALGSRIKNFSNTLDSGRNITEHEQLSLPQKIGRELANGTLMFLRGVGNFAHALSTFVDGVGEGLKNLFTGNIKMAGECFESGYKGFENELATKSNKELGEDGSRGNHYEGRRSEQNSTALVASHVGLKAETIQQKDGSSNLEDLAANFLKGNAKEYIADGKNTHTPPKATTPSTDPLKR